MTDLAVTPSGALYTISFTSLYSVNKSNAQATFVMSISGSGNNGMTFLPDGTLLVSDSAGNVSKIDPNAHTVSNSGVYGNGFGSSGDLVAVGNGQMFGISSTAMGGSDASSSNVLLRVNVSTGVATAVGPIGYGNVWGLAYANSRVIGFTNSGQIIQIDPATGQGTLLASKGIQFWGAGMSPLVAANPCH